MYINAKDLGTDLGLNRITAAKENLSSTQNKVHICDSFCFSCPLKITKMMLSPVVFITRSSITIGDKKITLNEQKFRMLCAFKQNQNKTLSRAFLLHYVWGVDCQIANNVNVMVSSLRTLLSRTGLEIITIRNKGYLMTYHGGP